MVMDDTDRFSFYDGVFMNTELKTKDDWGLVQYQINVFIPKCFNTWGQ